MRSSIRHDVCFTWDYQSSGGDAVVALGIHWASVLDTGILAVTWSHYIQVVNLTYYTKDLTSTHYTQVVISTHYINVDNLGY